MMDNTVITRIGWLVTILLFCCPLVGQQDPRVTIGFENGHTSESAVLAFEVPKGNLTVFGENSRSVHLYDIKSGRWLGERVLDVEELMDIQSVNTNLVSIDIDFDDYRLFDLRTLQFIDCSNGNPVSSEIGYDRGLTYDNRYTLRLENDSTKKVSKTAYLSPICEVDESSVELDFIADGITPDGRIIYYCLPDSLQRWEYLYDEVKGVTLRELERVSKPAEADSVHSFFRDGSLAYWRSEMSEQGTFRHLIWEVSSGRTFADLTFDDEVLINDVHPTDDYILLGLYSVHNYDGYVNDSHSLYALARYSLYENQIDRRYTFRLEGVGGTSFFALMRGRYSADGQIVYGTRRDRNINFFDEETTKLLHYVYPKFKVPTNIQLTSDHDGLFIGCKYYKHGMPSVKKWKWRNGNSIESLDTLGIKQLEKIFLLPRIKHPIDPNTGLEKVDYQKLYGTKSDNYWSLTYDQVDFELRQKYEYGEAEAGKRESITEQTSIQPIVHDLNSDPDHFLMPNLERRRSYADSGEINYIGQWKEYRPIVSCPLFELLEIKGGVLVDSKFFDYEELLNTPRDSMMFWYLSAGSAYKLDLVAIGRGAGEIDIFDANGYFQYTLNGHWAEITDLQFIEEGRMLLSASTDGSIRLWDLKKRETIAQLYLFGDNDWVVIGPNNLFDASPGAQEELYFVVTDGDKREIIELNQIKERYYEPGLLQKVLGYSEVPLRSVKGLETVALYPEVDLSIVNDSLRVELTPREGGIGRVALFVNGKELDADLRYNVDSTIFMVPLLTPEYRRFLLRENIISIQAYNQEESLHSADIEIEYDYADGLVVKARGTNGSGKDSVFTKAEAQDAKLHIICVGTSDYTGKSIDLTYPDQDAIAMSKALYTVGNELFGTEYAVNAHCLTTQRKAEATKALGSGIQWAFANKANIEKTLRQLQKDTRAQDVVLIYFSGHGKTINVGTQEQFHYLTNEANSTGLIDKSILNNVAISSAELTDLLKKMPAYKQVVILDACNSGQMIADLSESRNLNGSQIRALDRMSGRAGMYLIAGSAADKVSFEASNYGQGLLTYALLEGMKGAASLEADEEDTKNFFVGVTELFEYAQRRVPILAENIKGIQQPQVTYPPRAGSFPLGIYNEKTKIYLGDERPILLSLRLQNNQDYSDHLGLEELVETELRKENNLGNQARYIFIDLDKLPNAYQLTGRYTVGSGKNPQVSINAYLVQKGKPAVKLDIEKAPLDEIAVEVVVAINMAVEDL